MSRYHSYINTATTICKQFSGKMPLAINLKDFFKPQKKYGSKDRKIISAVCYQYYRAGHLLKKYAIADPFLAAHFLCEQKATPLLEALHPAWAQQADLNIEEKLKLLHPAASIKDLFPFSSALSADNDASLFCQSLLLQSAVYLRIRPGKKNGVIKQLMAANIAFSEPAANCLQLESGVKLDELLQPDKDVVIQDISSQQVLSYIQQQPPTWTNPPQVWDCCAASGGKSLLLHDMLNGKIKLTVSDNRNLPLQELKKRFAIAGIGNYQCFEADLTWPQQMPQPFDLIICDAPCTGSGTWSRTPEQLYFFEQQKIATYAQLQFEIAANVSQHLKPGGLLLYITCSVFEAENQAVAMRLCAEKNLQLLEMNNVYGYSKKADSLFWAALQK